MRILIYGNSGSGKSTLARALAASQSIVHLDLDTIVWEPSRIAVLRPSSEITASLSAFVATHPAWVIEGCYGELVEQASALSTELLFLNPGVDTCLANNARRPWEPHKYESPAAQDKMLQVLQAWVVEYYSRDDSWSYQAHRRIFDAHPGPKEELTSSEAISRRALAAPLSRPQ